MSVFYQEERKKQLKEFQNKLSSLEGEGDYENKQKIIHELKELDQRNEFTDILADCESEVSDWTSFLLQLWKRLSELQMNFIEGKNSSGDDFPYTKAPAPAD